MQEKIPCSVLVLTRNSAKNLDRCLQSVSRFAEIVIHDANSEDDSIAIAKKHGASIYKQYDTEEKSVRIKDFTEMRLKQRDAARYDWVFYIDSDEYITPETQEDIAQILHNADPKTIIKIPRIPIVKNKIIQKGDIFKEVMPRIHHRKSGATLKKGKTVHEKYEYDATFQEITTKNPLYFPLPELKELLLKDNKYIDLEINRMKRDGYSWKQYLQWSLFREPLIILLLCFKIMRYGYWWYPEKDSMPIAYNIRYVRYHILLLWKTTLFMMGAHCTGK